MMVTRAMALIVCACGIAAASGGAAVALGWQVTTTLLPGTDYPDPEGLFGRNVSLFGDQALVNGQLFDVGTGEPGRLLAAGVYGSLSDSRAVVDGKLFDARSGDPVGTLANGGPSAIDSAHLVVGEPQAVRWASGQAAVFDPDTGAYLRELQNPGPHSYDNFGVDVDLSGPRAIVGAWGGRGGDFASIFDVESGEVLRTLISNQSPLAAIAISGDFAAVTVHRTTPQVLVWDYVNNRVVQTLTDPIPAADSRFGSSLDFDGTHVLVGSPGSAAGGHAYLFDRDSGSLLDSIRADRADPSFGIDVALSGQRAVVGASGRAYVVAPVPLPATGLLAATTLAAFAAAGLRRQRAATAATSASGPVSATPRAAR